jgi:hypothetical protein
MKKYARILVAAAFVLGLSGIAKAASKEGIIVKLPFEFVVDGQTLSAGTYTVRRLSSDNSGPLILTSIDNGTSVFVAYHLSENASDDQPKVSFQLAGQKNFLSTIQTAFDVYHIRVSPSEITEATAKLSNSVSSSGGSE